MPSSLLAVGSKFLAFWSVQPSGTGRLICWAAFPEKSRNMPTSVLCLPLNPLTQHPPQSFYLADKTTSQHIDIVKKESLALISPNFFRKSVSPFVEIWITEIKGYFLRCCTVMRIFMGYSAYLIYFKLWLVSSYDVLNPWIFLYSKYNLLRTNR